jgi:hypothetical protein
MLTRQRKNKKLHAWNTNLKHYSQNPIWKTSAKSPEIHKKIEIQPEINQTPTPSDQND